MRVVQLTPCLRRVLALPRRQWSDAEAAQLATELTALLRAPNGTMTLRPIQAIALAEIGMYGGACLPIRVGGGKTLVSLLTPYVLDAKRPLLILPAKLIEKTRRAQRELIRHWRIPDERRLRIESYDILGRVQAAEMLERYAPDVVIADEAHRLKRWGAAVTKRVLRYLKGHPECRFVAMSGTFTRRSLKDYAHLFRRALGEEKAPVPRLYNEIEDWAGALDEYKGERLIGLGALRHLGGTDLESTRRAFRQRLVETPGVIATDDRFEGASLSINALRPKLGPEAERALVRLRSAWELPDSTPLADGLAVWRHARELALGFWYEWQPSPPKAWLAARKEWCSECRRILTTNRRNLDSELQVANAVEDGLYPEARRALEAWRAVRDTYRPNTVPVWIDDNVVEAAAHWAEKPGLIWAEHRAFGQRLAERTGLAYYERKGCDARGRAIEDADPAKPLIASVASNAEGRNLFAWNRNLVVSPSSSGALWEQLIGRSHREGQQADEVSIDVVITCDEHMQALEQARKDAAYIEAISGQAQKLLYADYTI